MKEDPTQKSTDDLIREKIQAEIPKIFMEIEKMRAESKKTDTEIAKIIAATAKMQTENRWYPAIVASTVTLAIVALTKLFL